MQYLSYFAHAFLMFVAPLSFIGYKTTSKQKIVFTILYGLGVIFFRQIYSFYPVPFGTHTILLLILAIILFKNIVKGYDWKKSIYTALIMCIILLINDSIVVLPILNVLNLSIEGTTSTISSWITFIIISNFMLILCLGIGFLKNKNDAEKIYF